ncbi:MAG: hypothetical protein R3A10_16595 [Caldilineaceae bacterium]
MDQSTVLDYGDSTAERLEYWVKRATWEWATWPGPVDLQGYEQLGRGQERGQRRLADGPFLAHDDAPSRGRRAAPTRRGRHAPGRRPRSRIHRFCSPQWWRRRGGRPSR